jgi:hypothetical protein
VCDNVFLLSIDSHSNTIHISRRDFQLLQQRIFKVHEEVVWFKWRKNLSLLFSSYTHILFYSEKSNQRRRRNYSYIFGMFCVFESLSTYITFILYFLLFLIFQQHKNISLVRKIKYIICLNETGWNSWGSSECACVCLSVWKLTFNDVAKSRQFHSLILAFDYFNFKEMFLIIM